MLETLQPEVARALSRYLQADGADTPSGKAAAPAVRAKRMRHWASGKSDASSEASQGWFLDSTQSKRVVHSLDDDGEPVSANLSAARRALRWSARATLWRASLLKSVRSCGCVLKDMPDDLSTGAGVKRRVEHSNGIARSGYSGTYLCGSVWACPRCSAVIAQRRAEEIGRAVRVCQESGGSVYLVTFTLRHKQGDALSALWEGLSAGWTEAFSQGSTWRSQPERSRMKRGKRVISPAVLGDGERFGVAGRIRTVEVTTSLSGSGGSGWHVHIHALVFTTHDLGYGLRNDFEEYIAEITGSSIRLNRDAIGQAAFAYRLFQRYRKGVTVAGFDAAPEGFDIRKINDGGSEFIGSYLSKATYDVARKIGQEVAVGAHTKETRTVKNHTAFELLYECSEQLNARRFGIKTPRHWEVVDLDGQIAVVDLDTGVITEITSPGIWGLWHEYELASKGKRQVEWSRALRERSERAALWDAIRAARGEEISDEEAAQVDVESEYLGEIPRDVWYGRLVWRPAWLYGALEAAENSGLEGLQRYLADRDVAFEASSFAPRKHSASI